MREYTDIAEMKQANTEAGQFFFSPGAMEFFNSVIETGVLYGRYFITSERAELSDPKRYTVRMLDDNARDHTVGEFQQHATLDSAKTFLAGHVAKVS